MSGQGVQTLSYKKRESFQLTGGMYTETEFQESVQHNLGGRKWNMGNQLTGKCASSLYRDKSQNWGGRKW